MIDISIQPWFIFALLSAMTLGVAELLQQKILNNKTKEEKFSVVESGFFTFFPQFVILGIILLLLKSEINIFHKFTQSELVLFLSVGPIGWLASCSYLKSFKAKNISLSTIFISLSAIVAMGLGYIFLGEQINFVKVLGFSFVFSAIILVSVKSIAIEKNNYYGLLGGALFGIEYFIASIILDVISPLLFIFWQYIFILITAFGLHYKTIINKLKQTEVKGYKTVFISGVYYSLFNILFYYAFYFGGEAGKIDVINNFNIFIIIIFEYFILKHKADFWLKITSFILALIGVVLLGMF